MTELGDWLGLEYQQVSQGVWDMSDLDWELYAEASLTHDATDAARKDCQGCLGDCGDAGIDHAPARTWVYVVTGGDLAGVFYREDVATVICQNRNAQAGYQRYGVVRTEVL